MKKINTIIALFALFILVAPFVSAWKWETHEYLAEQVCNKLSINCDLSKLHDGAIAPDKEFKDFFDHHAYYDCVRQGQMIEWCDFEKGCYDCSNGTLTDNIAFTKARTWLNYIEVDETMPDKSYDLGVATHYFFDAKVFFHQTRNEKESCHNAFEENVNKRIKNKDYSNWTECACGKCVSFFDFDKWEDEFVEFMRDKNSSISSPANQLISKVAKKVGGGSGVLPDAGFFEKVVSWIKLLLNMGN